MVMQFIKDNYNKCSVIFDNGGDYKSSPALEFLKIARKKLKYSNKTISEDIFYYLKKLYLRQYFRIESKEPPYENQLIPVLDTRPLNLEELEIARLQKILLGYGCQWQEYISNDGPENCIIKITKKKGSNYFIKHKFGDKMFGKQKRIHAWRMAFNEFLGFVDIK